MTADNALDAGGTSSPRRRRAGRFIHPDPEWFVLPGGKVRFLCPYHRRALLRLRGSHGTFYLCPREHGEPRPTDCRYRLGRERAHRLRLEVFAAWKAFAPDDPAEDS